MPDAASSQIFLGRQPILGREQQLLAYELLFRNGPLVTTDHAEIVDPTHATATVIANAFTEISTNEALGPYRGYINVDREFLFSDLIEALPPRLVVLEILETVEPTAEVIARCRQLVEKGFSLAIDDVVEIPEGARPLFALAEIIKVDVPGLDARRLAALVERLKPFGKKLLAEKVESAEQVDLCKRLGFELFQGYYFAKPAVIVGKKLNPSQLALLRLLTLVLQDADTGEIENAFKSQPGLAVNMLRLTNSVSNGLATRITSLRHAITLLGRRQLQRWLQLLIYTHPGRVPAGDSPLLQLAATRGRLMEYLAERISPKNREFADEAFLVGILSLMPALLGVAMEEILDHLPVAVRVRQALIDRTGPLGGLLQLAEATEQTDPTLLEEALQRVPGISLDVLARSLGDAFYWANNLGRERSGDDSIDPPPD